MSTPSHRIWPELDVVQPQDEVHHGRLAAAGAADQGRRLAGLGDEIHRMQDALLRTIAEHDVAELDAPLRDLELRRSGRIFLEIALVEEVVEHADAEQRRRQVDMEPRHALHRLVQHDDRGDEGEEASRRVAADDHGEAAVEHDGGDGEAAEALHDRAGARTDAGELVGRRLEAADRAGLTVAHEVLQGERLDDADALRGLLQRFHHLHRALELARHDLAHAEADLAHPDRGEGHEHQGERREQGVLRHHHDHEPDDGQRVARQRRDEEVEDAARRLGDEALPGDEFGRVGAAVVADLHPEHLVEDAGLNVGDDPVGDPRQHHLLAVGRGALDRVDHHDRRGDLPDGLQVPADEDLVDDPADDPGGERRGDGDQAHHREGEGIAFPVPGALVEQEPAQDGVRRRVQKRRDAIANRAPMRQ